MLAWWLAVANLLRGSPAGGTRPPAYRSSATSSSKVRGQGRWISAQNAAHMHAGLCRTCEKTWEPERKSRRTPSGQFLSFLPRQRALSSLFRKARVSFVCL